MSKVFRGKLIEGVKNAYYANRLQLDDDFKDSGYFESYIDNVVKRKWVVYAKSQFHSSERIVEYMSRYSHRTAIANSRIVSIENNTVRFRYRDYKDNNKIKTMKLTSDEFIKRFLYHIPPKRYHRIRYYGAVQRLSRIKNKKIVTTENSDNQINPDKPKCKKCQSAKSETIVVVDGNQKVVQGLMTPKILALKREIKFDDSS